MENVKNFVNKYLDAAKAASNESGIDYRIILTQAGLESAYGQFAFKNNFFGFKTGKNWTGKKQLLKTFEESKNPNLKFPEIISITPKVVKGDTIYVYRIRDWFRAYDTPLEGFLDHGRTLSSNKRYAVAMSFKNDPERFFIEIKKAGYATDFNYTKKLNAVYQNILIHL